LPAVGYIGISNQLGISRDLDNQPIWRSLRACRVQIAHGEFGTPRRPTDVLLEEGQNEITGQMTTKDSRPECGGCGGGRP